MPSKKSKLLGSLRNAFHSLSGSPSGRSSNTPAQGLTAPPIEDRHSFQGHPVATDPSSAVVLAARSASLDDLPTLTKPNLTMEEAKAQGDKHSPMYDHFMTVFKGFTSLVKKVEPCLDGTPFKTPATVFIAIVEAFEAMGETDDKAKETLDRLLSRMQHISKYYADATDEGSRVLLDDYVKDIVHDAQEIDKLRGVSTLKKLVNAEDTKSRVEEIIARIDRETTDFYVLAPFPSIHTYTGKFVIRILLEIEKDVKNINARLKRIDIQSWNRAPSAQYKADTVENQPKRQGCTKGTRVEVLQRIFEWAADAHSPHIFWLHGMAGSGKSTIAYTICEHFAKDDSVTAVLGASFFCSRQVVNLRRLGNIIPTLAYQLARNSQSFSNALDTVDRDVIHVSNEQVQKLLLGPWRDSAAARGDALPPTLIVIDALDEIEDKGGAEFLRQQLDVTSQLSQNRESKLKILVTSRPDPNIAHYGTLIGGDTVFRLEDLERSVNQGDIDLFLKSELPDLAAAKPHLLEILRERSEGLFIYVTTVARMLSSGMSAREQASELERILITSDASSIGNALDGVYSLYKDVLQKAVPSTLRSRRIPILHRIICTQQPLTIAALARLADVNSEEDVDTEACSRLVESLYAVLYISKSDKCVYVYHKSFSDFMLDEGVSGSDFPCQSGSQHGTLYRASLRIMTSSLRFNICGLPSSYLLDEEVPNLRALIQDNIYTVPGLEYACQFWTFHMLEAARLDSRFELSGNQLEDFVGEKMIFWIEVINLLREDTTCMERLGHVNTWVQTQTSISPRLKSLVSSILRLARSFVFTGAARSTPHLYLSCMTFDSALYHDLPTPWKDHLTLLPQICNSRTDIGFRLLTEIRLETSPIRSDPVSVAFSPDGKSIVVGSEHEQIYAHSASNGQMLKVLIGHTSSVMSVLFSCDGKLIASGSRDNSVRIWQALSGRQLRQLNGHTDIVCSVAFSPDSTRVASSSEDATIRMWDTIDGIELQVFQGHLKSVYSVVFSMDGTCIISGSEDRSVRVWNTLTSVETHRLDGHTDAVTCVAVSPVKGQILSGSRDRSVRIWDSRNGTPLHMFSLDGCVRCVAFSPDGTRIVVAAPNHPIYIVDAQSLECMEMLNTGALNESAKFSPDGTRIVTGSQLHVRVWDVSSVSQMQKLDIRAHTEAITCVRVLSDGARFISTSMDNTIRVWDALSAAELRLIKLEGQTSFVARIAVSPNDEWVVSGLLDSSVHVWNISTGQELHKLLGHTGYIESVAFSSDGSRIQSTSASSTESNLACCWLACIWDASSGENLLKLDQRTESDAEFQHAMFSTDGNQIISVCELDSIKYTHIHDLLTDEETVRSYDAYLDAYAVDTGLQTSIIPHSRRVQLPFDHATIRVMSLQDVQNGLCYTLQGHSSRVLCAAFSPSGTRVVSGGQDGSLRIWNLEAYDRVVKWKLDENTGWLSDPSTDRRLLWVPFDLHSGLYDGELCRFVISEKGSTRINMNSTPMGERWAECYQSSL